MTIATRTTAQLQRLHALLAKIGIDKETKQQMIYDLTGGRTSSAGDLMFMEAKELIDKLQKSQPGVTHNNKPISKEAESNQKMRRAILSRCYTLHWTNNDGVDYDRLNNFLITHGAVKKKLNDLNHDELVKVVTQFNTMDFNQFR